MSISNIDTLITLFFIYSFIGYIWEVGYVFLKQQKIINRGFLFGPVLPIYGCGAIIILYVTSNISNNILVFIYGMLSASALELITGMLMLRIFTIRYWDYSKELLNINGYICLKSSIGWGVLSVLLIKHIHPFIYDLYTTIANFNVHFVLYILIFIFAVDVTTSVKNAFDFKTLLETIRVDNNNNGIPDIVEAIPEHMKKGVLDAKKKIHQFKEKHPTAVFDKKFQEIIRKLHKL